MTEPRGRRPTDPGSRAATALAGALVIASGAALGDAGQATWDGRRVMAEAVARHQQYPYVYEEQSMVLEDPTGGRQVRGLRRYSRAEPGGTVKVLLVLDHPPEVRGVALLQVQGPAGATRGGIYLPALGPELRAGDGHGEEVLGTDFTVADLGPEDLDGHGYQRLPDERRGDLDLFVVDALPADPAATGPGGYGRRRHWVRQDNLFLVETLYFDHHDRPFKRRSYHDLTAMDGGMWAAGMVLMENLRHGHRSLLKVRRRVYSRDYVPAEMFTDDWLLGHRHLAGNEGLPPGAPLPGPAAAAPAPAAGVP